MLPFFPRGVLDEIWDLIESVSEGFPTYSYTPYQAVFTKCGDKKRGFAELHILTRKINLDSISLKKCKHYSD